MRVSRQAALGQYDLPAIEKLPVGRERNEHRRVAVLGNTDSRGALALVPCQLISVYGAASSVSPFSVTDAPLTRSTSWKSSIRIAPVLTMDRFSS